VPKYDWLTTTTSTSGDGAGGSNSGTGYGSVAKADDFGDEKNTAAVAAAAAAATTEDNSKTQTKPLDIRLPDVADVGTRIIGNSNITDEGSNGGDLADDEPNGAMSGKRQKINKVRVGMPAPKPPAASPTVAASPSRIPKGTNPTLIKRRAVAAMRREADRARVATKKKAEQPVGDAGDGGDGAGGDGHAREDGEGYKDGLEGVEEKADEGKEGGGEGEDGY
jgi:hypothetical protein